MVECVQRVVRKEMALLWQRVADVDLQYAVQPIGQGSLRLAYAAKTTLVKSHCDVAVALLNDSVVWVLKHHKDILKDTKVEARNYGETVAVAEALALCFNAEGESRL